eukprot:CAMPEP_0172510616 /NCGR_PEP_ID=MMETSP1066-20121228/230049_1 /TAXON_ID=671091 /ORGANISM="Coscinodiscus wailesii, Strain CCMP2513" /LENGTH=90 /DNA_ID=CAMNT_0013289671 /DNA_START=304 /DNA_END=576 /DNA_ORIENTATION=+
MNDEVGDVWCAGGGIVGVVGEEVSRFPFEGAVAARDKEGEGAAECIVCVLLLMLWLLCVKQSVPVNVAKEFVLFGEEDNVDVVSFVVDEG